MARPLGVTSGGDGQNPEIHFMVLFFEGGKRMKYRRYGEWRRQTAGGATEDIREKSRVTARKRRQMQMRREPEAVSHSIAIITAPGVGNGDEESQGG